MTISSGARLGPYQVLAPLGAGGMGEVYRARDSRLGRDVAIKVLPDSVSSDQRALTRFESEARAVAALSHPNILALYDVGEAGGVRYAVTELLEGETLRALVFRGALPVRRALEIAEQIARGLAAAHEKGIVHRDLKPENVFVTGDGRVKLLDFGLAKRSGPASGSDSGSLTAEECTEPGMLMGTVRYMSPEQVRGQAVDHRSDIFSFGAVLYELLTGQKAFGRATAAESMTAILKEDPPAIATSGSGPSPALQRILQHCLEKRPEARFQSTRDLVFAFETLSDSSPAPSEVLESEAPSVAVLPFADMSPEKDQDYFCEGLAEELIYAFTRIPGLRVASRTGSFQFKGKVADVPAIRDQLHVSTILEGSVRKSGDRLRVSVQLIKASDGFHLWSGRFDRDLKDVFAVQDEITEQVIDALSLVLTPRDRRVVARPQTSDVAA